MIFARWSQHWCEDLIQRGQDIIIPVVKERVQQGHQEYTMTSCNASREGERESTTYTHTLHRDEL